MHLSVLWPLLLLNVADTTQAQTDVKDPSAEPNTEDFLKREQALLGDDAKQFATVEDAGPDADDDLLGGGGAASGDARFESQFPDIGSPNEVGMAPCANRVHLARSFSPADASPHRASARTAPSPVPAPR